MASGDGYTPIGKDTFSISNAREKIVITNYSEVQKSPLSTLKKIQYDAIYGRENSVIGETLAEVLAVNMNVKRPGNLNYFNNSNVSLENGNRDWVVAICRIAELHASLEPPTLEINDSGKFTIADAVRIKQHGKFYVSADELRMKGFANIEIGDILVVEYLDKTYYTNGIIKDVFFKKDVSTMSKELKTDIDIRNRAVASGAFNKPGAMPGSINLKPPEEPIFINPVANAGYKISSLFGIRNDPQTGERKQHNGIDIAGSDGVPLYAMEEGIVDSAGYNGTNGNYVSIKHSGPAESYRSIYLHMLQPASVGEKQQVSKGQLIGYMGSTGKSTGNHLHLEIRKNNQLIDPAKLIDFTPWVPKDSQFDSNLEDGGSTKAEPFIKTLNRTYDGIAVRQGIDSNGLPVCYDQLNNVVPCPEEGDVTTWVSPSDTQQQQPTNSVNENQASQEVLPGRQLRY